MTNLEKKHNKRSMQNREVIVGDCIQTLRRKFKIKKSEYLPTGIVPVVDQSRQFVAGYINDRKRAYDGELPVLVFGDHTCVLKYVDFPFAIGADGTQLIRPTNDFDIRYFYYALHNLPLEQFGYQRHFKYLKTSTVSCPPMYIQRKIAAILGAYDDLIENNTRRIEILEEMAQTIYREWFVEFRFPGHENVKMVESELGLIPQGWEMVKTEQIIKRVQSGKKYNQKTVELTGNVPVLDQGQSGIIGYHNDSPGVTANEDEPIIVFANHTCYQRIIQYPFSAIQNVLPFLPKPERHRNIYWLHWATKDLVEINDYKGHWPEFLSKKLVLPPSKVCEQFGALVKPMVRLIYKLEKCNQNLHKTRDMLLPKLISGELDVSDLDIDTDLLSLSRRRKIRCNLNLRKNGQTESLLTKKS